MHKIWTTLFALGGILWLGASVARAVIGFDALIPGTTELKATQTETLLMHTIWLYTLLGGWTGWSFGIGLIGAIGSLFTQVKTFKQNGWKMMIAIFVALLIPAQAWVIVEDIELWSLFESSTGMPLASPKELLDVFLLRTTAVTSGVITGLSFLIGLTIVFLIVWRPLTREPNPQQNVNESR